MKRAVLIVAIAALCVAGSAVAQDRSGGLIGSGTRAENSGQMMGSGGFTISIQAVFMGSGGRTGDDGQILGSGRGGYLGSGPSVLEIRLSDGSSLLVVSSDEGMFVIPIEE
jgi:hypothetical protein